MHRLLRPGSHELLQKAPAGLGPVFGGGRGKAGDALFADPEVVVFRLAPDFVAADDALPAEETESKFVKLLQMAVDQKVGLQPLGKPLRRSRRQLAALRET